LSEKDIGSSQDVRLGLLVWYRLAHFYNQSNQRSNQHLKKWGLSIAQFDFLVQVGVHQPISQQELADKLLVSKGNITQMVVKMETAGLIERKQEWRIKHLTLTSKGQQLYEDVVPEQEQYQASQFNKLNKDEQKQLLRLLKKLQFEEKEVIQ
jgi:DNA-binding MarR family transcriptional regulator